MSTAPVIADVGAAEAGESSMFDSLARLVPEELQTAYYRVLAHTRTLSPDDEMLRILEAMGILALLTRHTPKDIADERERIQAMLDAHLQFSDEAQQKMLEYVHFIEGRLAELPAEIEAGLDPQQIAKILGESLRQHFVSPGVPDTVAGLQATSAAMGNVQKQLVIALRDLTDRDSGIAARVETANRHYVFRPSNAERGRWMSSYTNSKQTCFASGFRWRLPRRCSSDCLLGWKYKGVETRDPRR
jgi:predicted secreted protein